ncbi:unnamed protein product [Kuraishia capsulata CBS 1993]|uniref:37S ribosomal protein S25, mitochondrial n=1 Tax=Kuraishia capsulata CBS 1993 TaxID=1382522 RepID=W6MXT5_9ASCO|nr:uncharacterized protein KUCA_T00005433001 [Kuraishia capsulata CBS 1993]CDK29445.1 unnamed protein product [Kuraishia capsulata CBS 1993]
MKIQQNAFTVLERTSDLLRSRMLTEQPLWYKVVANNPPQWDLTRKVRLENLQQAQEADLTKKSSTALLKTKLKPSQVKNHLLKTRKLTYIEDELRSLFYDQHPWELADPKSLIENEATLNAKYDWSKMVQLYKKLDGESVVQRTLYIKANQPETTIIEAYDQARHEYYRLKMNEDIENSVTLEESTMFGAVFQKTPLEYGYEEEQKVLEKWRVDAIQQTEILTSSRESATSSGSLIGVEEDKEDSEELSKNFEGLLDQASQQN